MGEETGTPPGRRGMRWNGDDRIQYPAGPLAVPPRAHPVECIGRTGHEVRDRPNRFHWDKIPPHLMPLRTLGTAAIPGHEVRGRPDRINWQQTTPHLMPPRTPRTPAHTPPALRTIPVSS